MAIAFLDSDELVVHLMTCDEEAGGVNFVLPPSLPGGLPRKEHVSVQKIDDRHWRTVGYQSGPVLAEIFADPQTSFAIEPVYFASNGFILPMYGLTLRSVSDFPRGTLLIQDIDMSDYGRAELYPISMEDLEVRLAEMNCRS
ncbi:hypothetical protein J5O04_08205 [Corynebacterium hindlerae]|uniref:hypothetical protein n=1 Tax=Corynebacterium hindlerae TaxID=699041 RepID=UPI001AD6A8C3|nr:hypothetical protein [Corynebacterium hindlerae]QTH58819.1 hypothetical protein J5O04_08205 [Corynebacterium hindlerae]